MLPSTLNGIGGLGYDGQVHLQGLLKICLFFFFFKKKSHSLIIIFLKKGDYYIDTLNYEHDITFTISIQSVNVLYL